MLKLQVDATLRFQDNFRRKRHIDVCTLPVLLRLNLLLCKVAAL